MRGFGAFNPIPGDISPYSEWSYYGSFYDSIMPMSPEEQEHPNPVLPPGDIGVVNPYLPSDPRIVQGYVAPPIVNIKPPVTVAPAIEKSAPQETASSSNSLFFIGAAILLYLTLK